MSMQRILKALPPYMGPAVLSLGFVVLSISYMVYQRFLSPLRKIPGPFWASITPRWRIRRVIKGDWHAEIMRLHGKYGKTTPSPVTGFVAVMKRNISNIVPPAS